MRRFFGVNLCLAILVLVGSAFYAPETHAQTVGPGDVLISEFRLAGPGGFADEYIELYCNRDTDCDVSDYNIVSFDPKFGDFAVSFPAEVIIPARQHLLVGDDAGYTLTIYASIDLTASFGGKGDFFTDNEGIQLTNPAGDVVIDSVGFIGGGGTTVFIEGTGLQRATGARPADQYAYVRKENPFPQDTNDNSNDFVLVSVTGNAHPGITAPPVLGAPGPQGLTGPSTFTSAHFGVSLPEPAVPQSESPNRIRNGSGNSGTLLIRRSFTNNLGLPISYMALRVFAIPTLNTPGGPDQAQLRLVSVGGGDTFVNSEGRIVSIRGTILEFDGDSKAEPAQPNGGGLNSSVMVPLADGIMSPGETIDVQLMLNVVQAGNYRFYVNIEAFPFFPEGDAAKTRTSALGKKLSTRRPSLGPRRLISGLRKTEKPTKGGVRIVK